MKRLWMILTGAIALITAGMLVARAKQQGAMAAEAERDAEWLGTNSAQLRESAEEAHRERKAALHHRKKAEVLREKAERRIEVVREVKGDATADELAALLND